MAQLSMKNTFGDLFKKFRLRAEFSSLTDFGEALASEGFRYEDSIFSHWQQNRRVPKNRSLFLAIIKIFLSKKGINTLNEANLLLESASQGYLTEAELKSLNFSPLLSQPTLVSTKKILAFITMIGKSKLIQRTGWVENKIPFPESVADHSFRLCVLAMSFADYFGADREKLIQMAIVHDLGEVVTGDIIWTRGGVLDMKIRAEKEEAEKRGIEQIFKLIDKSDKYVSLFVEMIERKTIEAQIFWQLDKLEMAMQALEYEKLYKKNLDEFFISVNLQIQDQFLRKILHEIMRYRKTSPKSR